MAQSEFDKRAMKGQNGRVGAITAQKLVPTETKTGSAVLVPAHQLAESFHWKRWFNVIPQQTNSAFFQSDQNTIDFNVKMRHFCLILRFFQLTDTLLKPY